MELRTFAGLIVFLGGVTGLVIAVDRHDPFYIFQSLSVCSYSLANLFRERG